MNTSPIDQRSVIPAAPHIKQLLGPYLVGQLALVTVMQIVIWVRGPEIDLIDGFLLVPSWAYMIWFQYQRRGELARVRFGAVVTHAATFAMVNGSFHLAAMARLFVSSSDSGTLSLDASWYGPLLAMTGFWSIGLVAHIAASVAQRGFES